MVRITLKQYKRRVAVENPSSPLLAALLDRNPLPLFPSLRSAAPPPQIPRWFLLHHRWSRRSSLASSRRRPRVSRRPPPPPEPLLVRGLSLSPGRVEEHGEVKPRAGLSEREERGGQVPVALGLVRQRE